MQLPINTYGRSKLMVEMIMRDFAGAYGLRSVALRYFNAAGAAAEHGIGEARDRETHLIPLAIESALGRRGPIEIYGDDYATADGTCERDYVHVNDLAVAHVKAMDHLEAVDGFHAFNLGTGRPHSVRRVIAAVSKTAGHPVPQSISCRRAGDPARLFADPRLAAARLGWSATQSSLDEIVSSAWRWHATNRPEVRLAV
jgi:UDP-glucose 4-epimerase